jgi:hypothetical protein
MNEVNIIAGCLFQERESKKSCLDSSILPRTQQTVLQLPNSSRFWWGAATRGNGESSV